MNAKTLYCYLCGAISGPLNDISAANIMCLSGV